MGKPLHALIIADANEEALALVRELERGGFEPRHERVGTAAELRAVLRKNRWDILFYTEGIRELDCLEALSVVKEAGIDTPFVIVSRTISGQEALAAMQAGARDCIRNRRERIVPTVERELRDAAVRRESRQMEEEQRRDREIAERLAWEMSVIAEIGRVIGSTLNIDEVYGRFSAEARKLIPFDSLMVSLIDPEKDELVFAYTAGRDLPKRRKGDRIPFRGSVCEALMARRSGLILQPEDAEEIARRFPTLIHALDAGMYSMMWVPLVSADRLIGALVFRSEKQNVYTPDELSLAERIGVQIAGAVANVQLYDGLKQTEVLLRESEARFRAIFEQAAVGVAEFDIATGRYLAVNRRFCELLGMTEEEMLATTFQAITHPDDRRLHREEVALLEAGKIPDLTLEKRYLRKDGESVWVSVTVSPLRKTGETPKRNLAVILDIGERMRMQQQNDRHAKQLTDLHETSVELTSELNLNALLLSIAARALNLIGGTYCNCYLYRPEADLLERVASAGEELFPGSGTTRGRGEGLVGHIWEHGTALLIDDYHTWPGRNMKYESYPSRAMVGAPIHWGEEFLGVLSVAAFLPHRFTQADSDLLGMFATQAAIAIRNARLYGRIEQLAVQDELTDLLNRRGFSQLGEREFEGSLRFNRPLAALMFDIDHFKRVNDTYGHPAGDEVLRLLADCFRQNTRGIDVAGRHGGEEFVLLMPETLLPGAVQIAERLRQSIAELPIPIRAAEGDTPAVEIRITVSIGVAMLAPDVPSLAALLERADQAMYRAKGAGRNCVVVWEKSPPGAA